MRLPSAQFRTALTLLTLAVAGSTLSVAAEDPPVPATDSTPASPPETHEKAPYWLQEDKRQLFVAAGYAADDDSLRGFELGFGSRGAASEVDTWMAIWVTRKTSNDQTVTGLRADLVGLMGGYKAFGVGPLFSLGLENRNGHPDEGTGGFIGVGVETFLWTRQHWQLSLGIEHQFGISSPNRNQANLAVGYAWP